MRVGRDHLADLADLAPLVRRAVALDPTGLVRLRRYDGRASAFVRLPFGVLAARTIAVDQHDDDAEDITVGGSEFLEWLDGGATDPPQPRDSEWRTSLPPRAGWKRIDTVPDGDVRPLVRSGALALREAGERDGVPGAQPRADVADALLDSVVLTATDGSQSVDVTLRTISAVVRLGFLPSGSYLAVDVAGRWVRIAAAYGSVYAERPGAGLGLTPLSK